MFRQSIHANSDRQRKTNRYTTTCKLVLCKLIALRNIPIDLAILLKPHSFERLSHFADIIY